MAYTINLTDGTIFATVADGTINTTSSMTLVGKNYAGYGEFLDENFIHLLENGSNSTPPGNPLKGQLWFDSGNVVMKVYNGSTFKTIGSAAAQASAPTSNVTGDLWWDTTNGQLKVWNGTSWTLIGPASTSGQGTSGAIVTTITDNLSNPRVVVQLYVNNTIVGTVYNGSTFTPQVAIPGFPTIAAGIQLSTTVGNAWFRGTATNSQALDGLGSGSFMRTDQATQNNFGVSIVNNAGLTVGASSNGKFVASGSDIVLRNETASGNVQLNVNVGGVQTTAVNVNGSTGLVGVRGITNLNGNAVGNIGGVGSYFNTVFATATTALYADVAERFHADEAYAPGTVVELGGSAEITISKSELSENVFGVISTRAAYLMNAGAGTDETHPPVAMTGRVPVRVKGIVRKGDRLVSAGQGLARAARRDEITSLNVIGRSLQDKHDETEGTIEAIVMIN